MIRIRLQVFKGEAVIFFSSFRLLDSAFILKSVSISPPPQPITYRSTSSASTARESVGFLLFFKFPLVGVCWLTFTLSPALLAGELPVYHSLIYVCGGGGINLRAHSWSVGHGSARRSSHIMMFDLRGGGFKTF